MLRPVGPPVLLEPVRDRDLRADVRVRAAPVELLHEPERGCLPARLRQQRRRDLRRRQPRRHVGPPGDPPHPLGLDHDQECGHACTDVPAHLRRRGPRRRRLSLRPGLARQLRLGLPQAQRRQLEVPRQRVQAQLRAVERLRQHCDLSGQRQRVRRGAGPRQHQHRAAGLLGADLQDRRRGHHPGDDLVQDDGPRCYRSDWTRRRSVRQHAVPARTRLQVLRPHRRLGASPAAGEEGFDRGGGGQHRQPDRPATGGAEHPGEPCWREVGGGCDPPRRLGRQRQPDDRQRVRRRYRSASTRQLVHAPGGVHQNQLRRHRRVGSLGAEPRHRRRGQRRPPHRVLDHLERPLLPAG